MKTATLIKDISEDFTGEAKVYKLNKPMQHYDGSEVNYVVVSATRVFFSGPETYIFKSDKNGKIVSWSELDGSIKGTLSHSEALAGAGYIII